MDNRVVVRQMLKAGAKRRLFGYLLPCVGVALVGSLISSLFSIILSGQIPDLETFMQAEDISQYLPQVLKTNGLSLLFGLLISPLTVGSYAFFTEVMRDKKPPFTMVFTWLGEGRRLKTAYLANLWYFLISLRFMLQFCTLPGVLFYGSSLLFGKLPDIAAMAVYLLAFAVFIAACVFAYARVNAYLPALYMLASNPELPILRTFTFCGNMMRGRVWEFFVLRLSFLGWEVLAAFTCGLSAAFVTPYINLTVAGYTEYLKMKALEADIETKGTEQ